MFRKRRRSVVEVELIGPSPFLGRGTSPSRRKDRISRCVLKILLSAPGKGTSRRKRRNQKHARPSPMTGGIPAVPRRIQYQLRKELANQHGALRALDYQTGTPTPWPTPQVFIPVKPVLLHCR